MRHFTRINNGVATEHYIAAIKGGVIYYGYYIPGHENKKPTACITVDGYNKLCDGEQYGTIYPDGCTHGRAIPWVTQIVGERI